MLESIDQAFAGNWDSTNASSDRVCDRIGNGRGNTDNAWFGHPFGAPRGIWKWILQQDRIDPGRYFMRPDDLVVHQRRIR